MPRLSHRRHLQSRGKRAQITDALYAVRQFEFRRERFLVVRLLPYSRSVTAVVALALVLVPAPGLRAAQGPSTSQSSSPSARVAAAAALKVVNLGLLTNYNIAFSAVNDSGEVSGGEEGKAARWKNGVLTTFGTTGGYARGIDNAGNLYGVHSGATDAYPARWDAKGEHIDTSEPNGERAGYEDTSPNGTSVGNGPCPNTTPCAFVIAPPTYSKKRIAMESGYATNDLGHVAGVTGGESVFYNGKAIVPMGVYINGPRSINNHDYAAGQRVVGSGVTTAAVWHAGTTTPLPDLKGARAGDAHPKAINDSGVIVGQSDSAGAVIWQSGAIETLNSLLPKGSAWNLTDAFDISNTGYILGTGTLAGQSHYFLAKLATLDVVSGAVYRVKCGDTQCNELGLPGVTVLLQGKSDDGSPVKKAVVTGKSGDWSMKVKSGSYAAGPSLDGTTYVGPSFDPEQAKVIAGTKDVPGVNFRTCAASPMAAAVKDGPQSRGALAGSSEVNFCASRYTVNVSASIPQPVLVDPSTVARYNTGADPNKAGYNNSTGWIKAYVHNSTVRSLLQLEPEYPKCFADSTVSAFTEEHVKVEWYSYIKGGTSLGGFSVPLTWNQDTKEVHLVQTPTAVFKNLVRVFKYRYTLHGHVTTGQCELSEQVPLLYLPVAGADGTAGNVANNEFTILATWAFPFDPPGVKIKPESSIAKEFVARVAKICQTLYAGYESLPEPAKFALEFAVSYLIGTGEVEAVAAAPAAIEKFAGVKLSAGLMKGMKVSAGLAHWLHKAKTVQEIVGFLSGYSGYSGSYPVMSAVVRGAFTTQFVGNKYPWKTTLATSVTSTRFPNIELKITRDAEPATYQSNKVYQGVLPWKTAYRAEPVSTVNPFSAKNHAFLVSDSTKNNHSYASGEQALQNIIDDTNQMPAMDHNIGQYANLASKFNDEQAEAPLPSCTNEGYPNSRSTICWLFSDGKA